MTTLPQDVLLAAANLAATGISITAISRRLNISRSTLRRAGDRGEVNLAGAGCPEAQKGRAPAPIPPWIRDPIVRDDYRQNLRFYGEAVALREARAANAAIRAEMSR